MPNYPFLLFDADNTLLDFDKDQQMALKKTYYAADLHKKRPYSNEILKIYELYNHQWWKKYEEGTCKKDELFYGRFNDFSKHFSFEISADLLNNLYFNFFSEGGKTLPGAKKILDILSLSHQLYLITNGRADSQYSRMKNAKISHYFADFFVSENIGFGKPDIRYFQYVFSHIPDFEATKAVVIGDSLGSDILGANNAGLDSIWYNPKMLKSSTHILSTYEINNLLDVLTIV